MALSLSSGLLPERPHCEEQTSADLLPESDLPLTPGSRRLLPVCLGMASSCSPVRDGSWLRAPLPAWLLSNDPRLEVSRPVAIPPNLLLLAGMR